MRLQTISALRKSLWALGLGILTTIAFAWLLVLCVNPSSGSAMFAGHYRARDPSKGEGDGFVALNNVWAFGTRIDSAIVGPPGNAEIDEAVMKYASEGSPETAVSDWARNAALPWSTTGAPWLADGSTVMTGAIGRGWPLIALWCDGGTMIGTSTPPALTSTDPSGSFPLPRWSRRGPYWADILPYRPVCRGLAANTALYGMLWWLILVVPSTIRHRLRLRRNHCPHCNYNLQGLAPEAPCPECGRQNQSHRTAAPSAS